MMGFCCFMRSPASWGHASLHRVEFADSMPPHIQQQSSSHPAFICKGHKIRDSASLAYQSTAKLPPPSIAPRYSTKSVTPLRALSYARTAKTYAAIPADMYMPRPLLPHRLALPYLPAIFSAETGLPTPKDLATHDAPRRFHHVAGRIFIRTTQRHGLPLLSTTPVQPFFFICAHINLWALQNPSQ